jgi:hypothetical protein
VSLGGAVAGDVPGADLHDQEDVREPPQQKNKMSDARHIDSPKGDLGGGAASARWCSGGEGAGLVAPRAYPGCGASSSPAHREGGIVRWPNDGGPRHRNRGGGGGGGGLPAIGMDGEGVGQVVGLPLI